MAATGLLGINPYQKGIALDISSKPINLAIQLEQKEAAKKESLDKYFMDYEKSINPAGMRKQEGDVFLKKLAENKAFYIQNRDKILNPAKYGYDAQSQYMANFKGMVGLIDQSKQAAANDKIAQQHFMSQKGLNAPEGYKTDLELSHLPVTDPNYRPLDITRHKFYKSHDPFEYANKIYSKIPLSEQAPEKIDAKGMPGYFYTKTTSKVSPEYKNAILNEGFTNYENDEGLRKEINQVFDTNKAEVKRLEDKYGTKIPNAQALAGIYTWDLQPMKEATSDIKASEELKSRLILQRQKNKPTAGAEVANFLQGGVTALNTQDSTFINDYFKPFKTKTKTGSSGEIIGFENIDVLPDGKVKVNYSLPMTISRKGVSIVTKNPQSRILDPKSPSLLQELTALYQEFLGSDVKAEASSMSNPPKPPPSDGKKAKTYKGLDKNGNPIYE
jgi:hypothetical protein